MADRDNAAEEHNDRPAGTTAAVDAGLKQDAMTQGAETQDAMTQGERKRRKPVPWRLVLFLIVLGLFVAFAGLNAGHATDISFGFHTFESVPIFISLFAAFFLGALVVLPFTIFRRSKKKPKEPKVKKEKKDKKRPWGKKNSTATTGPGSDQNS